MNFLIIFASCFAYAKASTAVMAVVEYHPIFNTSLSRSDRILANTAQYVKIIESINFTNLDMIIFPEDTLGNNPETAVELTIDDTPCDDELNYPSFIRDISCVALKFSTYVAINLVTKIKCAKPSRSKNCDNLGYFFYNTGAIFDRNGRISNLYHKYNLFGERDLDKPPNPEEVVIETDFGIKFGIFICFDILFKSPAQDLLKKDVDAIIYPSMWFSQLPFLTSLQTQEMWARAHNITLFSSGANNPPAGSGGSSIVDGVKGMLLEDVDARGQSHAYTYLYEKGKPRVPYPSKDTDTLAKEMEDFRITADPSVEEYNSTILDISKDFNGQLCYNGGEENQLCCDFTIKIKTNSSSSKKNSYTYHLVAFSGVRSFDGNYNGGIEICGVIACLNSSLSSCGCRFPKYDDVEWPVTFEEIAIKAIFQLSENRTQYPNSLLSSIRPILGTQTLWEGEELEIDGKKLVERRFSLKKPQNRLLTFAIFGRNFAQDSPPKDDENNSIETKPMGVTWFLTISVIILAIFASK